MIRIILTLFLFVPLILTAQIFQWNTTDNPKTNKTEASTDAHYYTIQVGTFIQPKLADFYAIQEIGQLYARNNKGESYDVFIGTFDSQISANATLQQVRDKGYPAYILEQSKTTDEPVAIIQLFGTKNRAAINWASLDGVEKMYGLMEDASVLKVVVGPYASQGEAMQNLTTYRQQGFQDAFIKMVNPNLLTPIGCFEKGMTAKPSTKSLSELADAIDQIAQPNAPSNYSKKVQIDSVKEQNIPQTPIQSEEKIRNKSVVLQYSKTLPIPPVINPAVKRTSALDLQRILKLEKYYQGSLNGYYNEGTALAYQQFQEKDQQYNKYRLVAEHLPNSQETTIGLQYLIDASNNNDALVIEALRQSNHPIAKAYFAYWKRNIQGYSEQVNHLMNAAIRESFTNQTNESNLPFDPTASYDYANIKQLAQHLFYLHTTSINRQYAVPCWLIEVYPNEAKKALEIPNTDLVISNCLPFEQWESVMALLYFIQELQPQQFSPTDQAAIISLAEQRQQIYLFPTKLDRTQKKAIDNWKIHFWEQLSAAAATNPLLAKYYAPLQIVFFQSQAAIEDVYMRQGFTADEAEGLALSILRSYLMVPMKPYSETVRK